jgi:hypothetical protein
MMTVRSTDPEIRISTSLPGWFAGAIEDIAQNPRLVASDWSPIRSPSVVGGSITFA